MPDMTPEQRSIALNDPFYLRFWPERLAELTPPFTPRPYRNSKPRGVFVCDIADLFGIGVPNQWTEAVLDRIMRNPCDRFYLLTKQPQNLAKFSPFPDNCWVGVTATDYGMFVDACGYLGALKHEGKIKVAFVSIEPLLSWDSTDAGGFITSWLMMGDIDQVIIGAQTRPTVYPKVEWVQEIVEAADKAGIPVFLKNNLLPIMGGYPIPKANMWAYKFEQGRFNIRQEMPKNEAALGSMTL